MTPRTVHGKSKMRITAVLYMEASCGRWAPPRT